MILVSKKEQFFLNFIQLTGQLYSPWPMTLSTGHPVCGSWIFLFCVHLGTKSFRWSWVAWTCFQFRFIYLYFSVSEWLQEETAPSEFTQLFVKDIIKDYIDKDNLRLQIAVQYYFKKIILRKCSLQVHNNPTAVYSYSFVTCLFLMG